MDFWDVLPAAIALVFVIEADGSNEKTIAARLQNAVTASETQKIFDHNLTRLNLFLNSKL